MGIEIERKFLVDSDSWRSLAAESKSIRQAYLSRDGGFTVRVRVTNEKNCTLTIKSSHAGMKRLEFEYEIPFVDADQMMSLRQGAIIEKTRYIVPWSDLVWEIDVFAGENAGLIMAEIELAQENQAFNMPAWIGREVTADCRFYNSRLATTPFGSWDEGERDRVFA